MRIRRLNELRRKFINLLDQKIGREKMVLRKYIRKLEYLIEKEEKKDHTSEIRTNF